MGNLSAKQYNWKGRKVLIVEDDPAGSLLLAEILMLTGIEVRQVENGKEAVDICRHDPAIDIVHLDMQVPGMSGYDAAVEIRKIRQELPIIAQSAFVYGEEKQRALQAGCNAHISKPLNKIELLGTINRLLPVTGEPSHQA